VNLDEALAAVLSQPLANTPRIRYAEAVGGPRAELVRAQLEADRLEHGRPRGAPLAIVDAKRTAKRLIDANGRAWAGGTVSDIATAWEFRRGFVERVTVDARAWVARGRELAGVAPINQLSLRGLRGTDLNAVFGHVGLERVLALDLSGEQLGDKGLQTLLSSPRLGQLRWLSLYDNRITMAGAEALAASTLVPNLQFVAFGNNYVDPTATPGGIDDDGAIMGWDLTPEGQTIAARYGFRPWQKGRADTMASYPPDLYDLVRPS
jgi:hypothetical protein